MARQGLRAAGVQDVADIIDRAEALIAKGAKIGDREIIKLEQLISKRQNDAEGELLKWTITQREAFSRAHELVNALPPRSRNKK